MVDRQPLGNRADYQLIGETVSTNTDARGHSEKSVSLFVFSSMPGPALFVTATVDLIPEASFSISSMDERHEWIAMLAPAVIVHATPAPAHNLFPAHLTLFLDRTCTICHVNLLLGWPCLGSVSALAEAFLYTAVVAVSIGSCEAEIYSIRPRTPGDAQNTAPQSFIGPSCSSFD